MSIQQAGGIVDGYLLGLIWGIGSYSESRITFRHKDKCFIDYVAKQYGITPYQQFSRTNVQWTAKTHKVNIDELIALGWTPRNANERHLPKIDGLNDFLRAYMEIHSRLDCCPAYKRKRPKGGKYYKLRLRIYGNNILLSEIAEYFSHNIHSQVSAIEKTCVEKSGILNYTKYNDIQEILNLISGTPHHKKFWLMADQMMRLPVKNSK